MFQLSARRTFWQRLSKTQATVPQVPLLWKGHQKACSKRGKGKGNRGGYQVCATDSKEKPTTSWDEDKSTNKDNKGKGHDWTSSIKGMSLDEACTWFKDYKTLTAKSVGKTLTHMFGCVKGQNPDPSVKMGRTYGSTQVYICMYLWGRPAASQHM